MNKHVVDLEAAKARLRVVEKHASSSSRSSPREQPQVKPPRNLPPTNIASDGGKAAGGGVGGNLKPGVGEDNYVKYNNSNGGGKNENR